MDLFILLNAHLHFTMRLFSFTSRIFKHVLVLQNIVFQIPAVLEHIYIIHRPFFLCKPIPRKGTL